jgi:hypothetical protein
MRNSVMRAMFARQIAKIRLTEDESVGEWKWRGPKSEESRDFEIRKIPRQDARRVLGQ